MLQSEGWSGPSPSDSGGPPRPRARKIGLSLLLAAAVAFLVLGGLEAWRDSATYDEPVYVSAGLEAVLHHNVVDNEEHPPLFKVLAVLRVLAVSPVITPVKNPAVNAEWIESANFVHAQLRADTMHRVTFASRLVPLLECVVLAFSLYALASLLFGFWPGVVAGLLWLLDPVVLGYGHLDGVDIPFALTAVWVSWALVIWLQRRTRRALLWLGAACGAAVLAQSTGMLLGAVALMTVTLAAYRGGERGWRLWRQPVWVAVVAWAFVWAVYVALDPGVVRSSPIILPKPYIEGLRYLIQFDRSPSVGFLLGASWNGSNIWFWPATLLVKVSTPVLLLLVSGPVFLVALVRSGTISRTVWRHTLVAVVIPAVVLFVFEVPNPRSLGVRYLLPSLALWGVVASPLALLAVRRLWVFSVALAVVLALATVATASSFPNSIAYTAPPSALVTGWPPIPTWTGVRISRNSSSGPAAVTLTWRTSDRQGSQRLRYPGPGPSWGCHRRGSRGGWLYPPLS